MPITMAPDRENVYRAEIRGILHKADLDQCQRTLAAEIARIGRVRLLIVLSGFEGWEAQGAWNDLGFYVRHGDMIERIAIAGDERWRGQTMMFAGADLRKAPVEFFPDEAAARAWLSG